MEEVGFLLDSYFMRESRELIVICADDSVRTDEPQLGGNPSRLLHCGTTLAKRKPRRLWYRSIYLVDVANKKKYFVVLNADGHRVCSRDFADITSKASANL